MSEYHIPVLLDASVSALITNKSGLYIDATFGGGGHTAEILSRLDGSGKVIAFDRDTDALRNAPEDKRLLLVHPYKLYWLIQYLHWRCVHTFLLVMYTQNLAIDKGN